MHPRPGPGGLEPVLRSSARPPFALEGIGQVGEQQVVYGLLKPQRYGGTARSLIPLEFIDHLTALMPPPRRHRQRYHGVLAPNAPLRLAVTAYGRHVDLGHPPSPPEAAPAAAPGPSGRSPAHDWWAMRLVRLCESLPRISPARGPPAGDDPPVAAVPPGDALAQPQPDYVCDQQLQG